MQMLRLTVRDILWLLHVEGQRWCAITLDRAVKVVTAMCRQLGCR